MALSQQQMTFFDCIFSGMSPDEAIIKAGCKCKTKKARANQATRLNELPEGIAYRAGLREVQQTQVKMTSKEWLKREIERA